MIDNQNKKQQSRRSFRIYSLFKCLYFVYPKAYDIIRMKIDFILQLFYAKDAIFKKYM